MQANKRALLTLAVLGPLLGTGRAAELQDAVSIDVGGVAAKVGQTAHVLARIAPRTGFVIAHSYRNRIVNLTGSDDGVEFPARVVSGKLEDGALVFKVAVVPKRAGEHAINGVIRFAYVTESDTQRQLEIRWAPLIATVTATA
jgi:hypothetical protein